MSFANIINICSWQLPLKLRGAKFLECEPSLSMAPIFQSGAILQPDPIDEKVFSCVFIILREVFFNLCFAENPKDVWENVAWTYLTSPLCTAKWANIVSCIDGKMADSTPLMSTPMPSNTKLSGPRGLKYLHRHSFLAKSFRQIFKRAFLKSFNSLTQQCIIYAFCTSCRFQEDFTFLS